ncbi:MAG: carbohydrate kinase family protein, partial [Erysipelotrichaceae bacterium]|nr:carbohydrate kinase family protein [Erysipelotrichaceae bacterium]
MDEYLLTILGSSADYFYEADSYPVEGDFSHGRYAGMFAGGCPLNVGAVCASKGIRVKALDMLGKDDETTPFLLDELKKFNIDTENIIIQKEVANGKVVIIVTGEKRTMFVIDPIRPTYVIDDRIQGLLNDA